ncbi:hypothetical protein ACFPM7_26005 [Actinokineospora guangxiensis]|uniref:Uncharacterized protein n=1 Tax=Actinokineospora guangxiensis TaxID=1490288 RepID=A0ABW0ETT8_9PSEU
MLDGEDVRDGGKGDAGGGRVGPRRWARTKATLRSSVPIPWVIRYACSPRAGLVREVVVACDGGHVVRAALDETAGVATILGTVSTMADDTA